MFKRKPLFVTFEGTEGSGKSYQCKKLFNKLKKIKLPVVLTREPGGTKSAEKIRNVILGDYFASDSKEKFSKCTDPLLYLAARNEHVQNIIKPALSKNRIVISESVAIKPLLLAGFALLKYGIKKMNIAFFDGQLNSEIVRIVMKET